MACADDFEDAPPEIRICGCGCTAEEHDPSGRCRCCGPDECGGFTLDPEASMMAAIGPFMDDADV